LKFSTHLRL